MPIPPPFNPSQQQWGLYPVNQSKPTCSVSSSENGHNGYIRGVIKLKAGHPLLGCANSYGPWTYSSGTGSGSVQQAVKDVQAYFGLTVDGVCGPQTWPVIDYLAGL